ncbi:MAG TPA: hypothetical protein VES95_12665 [Dermatophilaceae bacterium]|nr:hypothetical protein [Dermatophilaceae bacterium]
MEEGIGATGPDRAGPPCAVAGTNAVNAIAPVLVLGVDEIRRRLALSSGQVRAVRDGAAVMIDRLSPPGDLVRLVRGTYRVDPTGAEAAAPQVRVEQDVAVPVLRLPDSPPWGASSGWRWVWSPAWRWRGCSPAMGSSR